ncbi:PAQR family membrane homeostasis protein TrhA [Clostridium estertheticum]|uniref:PAQR family membrane homeostasis protein TrhA n=1 Tax=Clostridium estertheticum TaxID=238834 RepID=UPI0021630A30|nr:hemolysin III family protein [Clostridium estertheticum]
MISKTRVSGIIHIVGGVLAIAALVLLVVFSSLKATAWHIVSFSIFGTTLVLLYTMSSLYHMLPVGSKVQKVFRYFDHMAIYLLIAGTYTPIALIPLRGGWGWSMFGVIWGLAIMGIIWKSISTGKSRTVSTILYVLMGWVIIIAFHPMIKTIPIGGLFWLVLGGLFYSIGGIIYGLKKPNFNIPWFGFHEIFHVFIILGSFCHFWMMFNYFMYIR